jgi:hypothetical protein
VDVLGPETPATLGVPLVNYAHVLRQVVPSAELVDVGYGLQVQWGMRLQMNATRAVNEKHATEMMLAFGEQIRARAVRELGVQPILDGHRREVEHYRDENRLLRGRLASALDQVAQQADTIAALTGDPDE